MGNIRARGSLMFHVEQTKDKELVKKIISDEEIKNGFPQGDYQKYYFDNEEIPRIFYLLKYKDDVGGIGIFSDFSKPSGSDNVYTIDVGFFKKYRGKKAIKLAKLGLDKFYNENKCNLLVSRVYKDNYPGYINAKWCGFECIGETDDKYIMRYQNGR